MEAKRLGITATDDDVRRFLHTGQWGMVLFPDGKFIGDAQYAEFVSEQFQMTREKFENEVKKEMIESRLRALVTGGVTVSDGEVRSGYVDQATKIKFDYAVIDSDTLRNQINPSDTELQAFLSRTPQSMPPPFRKRARFSTSPSPLPICPRLRRR